MLCFVVFRGGSGDEFRYVYVLMLGLSKNILWVVFDISVSCLWVLFFILDLCLLIFQKDGLFCDVLELIF